MVECSGRVHTDGIRYNPYNPGLCKIIDLCFNTNLLAKHVIVLLSHRSQGKKYVIFLRCVNWPGVEILCVFNVFNVYQIALFTYLSQSQEIYIYFFCNKLKPKKCSHFRVV